MQNTAEPISRLADKAKNWKKAMADNATGPLAIAPEIVTFVENEWEAYKAEADGLSPTQWLDKFVGWRLGWFKRRARAVAILGKAACRAIHHEVAVYLLDIPDDKREAAKMAVMRECKRRGDIPLTRGEALPIIHDIIGHSPKRKTCATCARLRLQLQSAGLTPEC